MDILRAILDGVAMSAVFNGASAVLALLNPRFFFDSYPKLIQKAAPLQMTKAEHRVNDTFAAIVIGICAVYEIVSNLHTGTTGFWQLFCMGYINWMLVNLGDFFLLDCLLFQGKYKDRIMIPGTEGHPDYECGNWMKHLGLPEHFIIWPFLFIPFCAAGQAGIVLLLRTLFF